MLLNYVLTEFTQNNILRNRALINLTLFRIDFIDWILWLNSNIIKFKQSFNCNREKIVECVNLLIQIKDNKKRSIKPRLSQVHAIFYLKINQNK